MLVKTYGCKFTVSYLDMSEVKMELSHIQKKAFTKGMMRIFPRIVLINVLV